MHTHARFGGQFQEIPRPSGIHELPRLVSGWFALGGGTPRGPGTTSLLPKITLPEPVGWEKRSTGNNRSGSETRPWGGGKAMGCEKYLGPLYTTRSHQPASARCSD